MLISSLVKQRLLFICAMLCSQLVLAAELLRFEGRALDPETQALLYIEKHQVVLDDIGNYLSSYVTYIDPYGEVFAEKTLNFSGSQLAPDLMFHDKRHDERITVSVKTPDAEKPYIRILIEQDGKRDESRVNMNASDVVIDAGFDRLLASQWQQLRQQKELDFSFLAITRAQLIKFEAIEESDQPGRINIELHPRNFFIDLLVKPINLEYDPYTRRLLRFTGLTNIEQYQNGQRTYDNYIADIYYQYQPIQAFPMTKNDRLTAHE